MSKQTLGKLQAANDMVTSHVDKTLRKAMATIDLTNPVAARAALFEAIPPLVDAFGNVAASVAAEWFEEFRVAEGLSGAFRAELADTVAIEAINGRLGFATRESGHLFHQELDEFVNFVSLMVNEYVMQPGHDTIMHNAHRDNAAFARVPEPGACEWCLMLASRGFVYSRSRVDQTTNKQGEISRFHAYCRCHAMPVWDETRARVEYGYDPDRLYDEYVERRDQKIRARQANT